MAFLVLLLVDNYDSFTHNVARYFRELDVDVKIIKNDQLSVTQALALRPYYIVISPGPGNPSSAGISLELIERCAGDIPLLGICLGHQAIAQAFGGSIDRASSVVHGKTSLVNHGQYGVFKGLPNPFRATRYHSLIVNPVTLPAVFEISAWVGDGDSREIMGICHNSLPLEGVQFHPESVMSECGHQLLKNFVDYYA